VGVKSYKITLSTTNCQKEKKLVARFDPNKQITNKQRSQVK
jgi:hypothetical protein